MSSPRSVVVSWSEMCHEDRIVQQVWKILAADADLAAVFGVNIFRRQVLAPPAEGSPLQLVVAPVHQNEDYVPGATVKATIRVGVMVLFESFARNLQEGEPSVLTVLSHVKRVLASADPNLGGLVMRQKWSPLEPTPLSANGKSTTSYAVGEVIEYDYRSDRFTRKAIRQGPPSPP